MKILRFFFIFSMTLLTIVIYKTTTTQTSLPSRPSTTSLCTDCEMEHQTRESIVQNSSLTTPIHSKINKTPSPIQFSDITLYYRAKCPYCVKVLDYLESIHKADPRLKNVAKQKNLEELVKIGGKAQVPCLVVKDEAIYESDTIIMWIKNHKNLFPDRS